MRIAYLIMVHKSPPQLERLIRALEDETTFFIIHVDKKVDIHPFLQIKCNNTKNLFFLSNREKVSWGGFSQVKATLNLIDYIFSNSIKIDFASLISGQDFPIINKNEIKNFLQQNNQTNFLSHTSLPYEKWGRDGGFDRFNYYWLLDQIGPKSARLLYFLQKLLRIKRKAITFPQIYGGSNWWTLNSHCLEYIYNNKKNEPKFHKRFAYTFCTDEIYFHTLLLNSPLKHTILNQNMRYVDWDGPPYPRLLKETDYTKVIQSGMHFARKVEENGEIIELLEKHHSLS